MVSKAALVTGASGGIGRAIARQLAKQGVHVRVHYNTNETGARQTVQEIQQSGGQASLVCFDIADGASCSEVLGGLVESQGALDILVLNAGISDDSPFAGMKARQWTRVIDTSLNSFYHVTRPLIMPMIRNRWGRIVSVSSLAALHGSPGQSNYAAAKAGLIGASRSLAREVASRGICVNVVAPGFIDTPMIESVSEQYIRQIVPMKRAGRPEEIASVVAFLCSESASYLTGEVINVSGGVT